MTLGKMYRADNMQKLLAFVGAVIVILASAIFAQDATVPLLTAARVIDSARDEKAPVISAVTLDCSGQRLAAVGDDHHVRIYSVADMTPAKDFAGHRDWVRSAAFRPDGNVLATAGDDGQVRLWGVGAERFAKFLLAGNHPIYRLVFSPDGQWLAAAGYENKVRIYDGRKGELVRVLDAPGDEIRAVAFSPGGKYLAAGGRLGTVRVWEPTSGRILGDLTGGRGRISAVAYSPDGRRLAAGQLRTIRLWDVATGQASDMPSDVGNVMTLVFCDNQTLACGGSANDISLWDVAAEREKCRLVGHTGSVTSLDFDVRSGALVSGSFDTTVRVWQLNHRSGPEVAQP
jgi:WD40 repeat protein